MTQGTRVHNHHAHVSRTASRMAAHTPDSHKHTLPHSLICHSPSPQPLPLYPTHSTLSVPHSLILPFSPRSRSLISPHSLTHSHTPPPLILLMHSLSPTLPHAPHRSCPLQTPPLPLSPHPSLPLLYSPSHTPPDTAPSSPRPHSPTPTSPLLAHTALSNSLSPSRTHISPTHIPPHCTRPPFLTRPRSPRFPAAPPPRHGPPSGDVSRACTNGRGASRPPLPRGPGSRRGAAQEKRTHAGELETGH